MKLNLFELAELRLKKEKKQGIIPCYTEADVIEYAVIIRRWLDSNKSITKRATKLTKAELKRNNLKSRHRYYLKTGR